LLFLSKALNLQKKKKTISIYRLLSSG